MFFYWLCFVKDTLTDVLGDQKMEERDPDLNVEEDIML